MLKICHTMFKGCKKFKGKGLENWNTSKVLYTNDMFHNCLIFNCDLSSWNISKVKYMDSIFTNCDSLKK